MVVTGCFTLFSEIHIIPNEKDVPSSDILCLMTHCLPVSSYNVDVVLLSYSPLQIPRCHKTSGNWPETTRLYYTEKTVLLVNKVC